MKKWFLNLKIKHRLNTMTTISIFSILLIGYASYYFFRTTRVLTLVLTEQRVHDVNYRTGLQLFYEYLHNNDEQTLTSAYHHLDSAANIAYVFSKSKEYYNKYTHEKYVDVLLETYGPTINYERNSAELIASRFELMMMIDNPQMNDALEIADEAYRNGKNVKTAIQNYLENPEEVKLFEKLETAKLEMSDMEVRFSATIDTLNTFVINLLLISILLIVALLSVFTFISSRLISGTIARPVLKVVDNLKQLASGILTTDIKVESKDEIGMLNASFIELQNSLKQKSEVSSAIANGDFSLKTEPRSKDDELAYSINQIVKNFSEVVEQANRIARGELETNITMRSDHDELGKALIRMTTDLKSSNEEKRRQLWQKNSQGDINDVMRGEQEVHELSQKIISKLCKLIEAKVGAIYIKDEDTYRLVGSFAFNRRKNIDAGYKSGQGIVGQAVLEKQAIIITNVPDDYTAIASGLGEAPPKNLLVSPCVFNDDVVAVIEVGSFDPFTEDQLQFLKLISENIAIGLHASKGRTELKKLLAKTQQQAEELQVQQEELRQANEELEEQTKALKESEQQLQTQQEELRVTNEELEERTKAIEKQRDDIRKKNDELKIAQIEIEKKAADLEMASRYKSEFLANMSHELRTPLNSILVLSQILSNNKSENLNDKQIQSAKTIHSSGSSLLSLINEILDLSKIESGKLEINEERMQLKSFMVDVEEIFKPLAIEKGLDLNLNIDADAPVYIHTDSLRLQQILRNLLSNAIKFTHEGSVNLKIKRPKKLSDDLENKGLEIDSTVVFEVRDTGIGIPEQQQKTIFEAFTQADGTTSRKYGGTGLGLTISRNLAHILGGDIEMQSSENNGTTFTLYLPVKRSGKIVVADKTTIPNTNEKVSKTDPGNTDNPGAKTQTKTHTAPDTIKAKPAYESVKDDRKIINKGDKFILIIEDDPDFSQILYDLAHEKGFKCLIAPNGETGLHYADYYKPDAIILDIGLPGIDGWQVMDRLKENPETRHLPVHFMSGRDKSQEAMKKGAIGFLTKPISIEEIEGAFTKIESYISKPVKKLLVIEDDDDMRKAMVELIDDDDINITSISTGRQALDQMKKDDFDCIILDLGLKDMSGYELLKKIGRKDSNESIPVIIYTGQELSREDEEKLSKYSDSIIIKGAKSPERLLAETTLFLHRVESNLPEEKQKMLKVVHSQEDIIKEKKVLIVDDDMRNVFALSSLLEERSMKIVVGRNGKEGLEKLEQNPDINIILMDIMMPEMDGYEAMKIIRRNPKYKKLPVIALTAKAMQGDRDKCIEAGASDYLTKPVDTEKLISLLRVWLYQ
ncbi:MAG: response regulator [Bacteroidales bacterium]|nr:response regulator [Bacteroidales bacterium]